MIWYKCDKSKSHSNENILDTVSYTLSSGVIWIIEVSTLSTFIKTFFLNYH